MSKNEVEVKETSKKNNKKRNILIIIGVFVLAFILFLLWFFNRKFDVTFDFNNGSNDLTVKVKYNKVINEKDIQTKEDLGERFIDWFEVTEVKDGKDVLAEKAYDFTTKIKEDVKLKAVYEAEKPAEPEVPEVKPEYITISFDTRGGSKVNSVKIEKDSKLTLPSAPTYKGYKFVRWETKNGKEVKNNTVFSSNTTIYAKWQKIEETPAPTPAPEPTPEESISLTVNNKLIHKNGIKTSQATANVQNSQGNVTYSIESKNANLSKCVMIDSVSGLITAIDNTYHECVVKMDITVKATSKTGKVATTTVTKEADLYLRTAEHDYSSNARVSDLLNPVIVYATHEVEWELLCAESERNCTYIGEISKNNRVFKGKFLIRDSRGVEDNRSSFRITAKTAGGQKLTLTLVPKVN